MERYGVSNATAQHAVKILKSEGLLESQVGSGTRVRRPRPMVGVSASYLAPPEGAPWPLWRDEAAKLGLKGTERLGKVRKVKAPDPVAHALELEPGTEVVLRPRVMLLDDEPVQLADSYYPADLADGTPLAQVAKIRGGAPSVLAELGHKPAESAETVTAGMPSQEEDKALGGLPAGVPVLRVVRTITDADGRPVEVCLMTMDASRHRLEYRLPFHS
jgi:GntR family transcriptional regulator